MSYCTYYAVYTKDGTAAIDQLKTPYICFAAYNNYAKESLKKFGENRIEIKVLKKYETHLLAEMLFNSEQVHFHIEKLASIGFSAYVVENKDEYRIFIHENDYICKNHLRIALDFIRLLWEKDINQVLDKYFKMSPEITSKHDYLLVLECIWTHIQSKGRSNNGHSLPNSSYGVNKNSLLTSEQVIKKLSSKNEKTLGDGSFCFWSRACGNSGAD